MLPSETIPILLSLLFAVGFLGLVAVLRTPEELIAAPGSEGAQRGRIHGKSILLKIFGGAILTLADILEAVPMGGFRTKLEKRLVEAGNPGGFGVNEFNAARCLAIVFLGMAGAYIDFELDTSPMVAVLLALLGFFYPDIWLRDTISLRRRRIFRDLPDILDMLRLAVDAGLDLSSAMRVVVEQGRKGPLLDELEKADREMSLGVTRKDALKNMADRIAMTEMNAFVIALVQADQLGASIGPILKVQGEMARTRRWQLAEALVNKMPMKMLAPLVCFIFPASFIILFTPLIIQWMQSE